MTRKYGIPILDARGAIVALSGKVRLGDEVTWLGRKRGNCREDDQFTPGQGYRVCAIYPSNFDLEIERADCPPHVTIRAGEGEYALLQSSKEHN